MITLYQYPAAYGLPVSVSPYCAKLEAYLRLTGREYQTAKANPQKSPNRKVPYIAVDGGALVADTHELILQFEREGPALDAGLDDEQRSRARSAADIAHDRLYFAVLYSRFSELGWGHQSDVVRGMLPWLLRPILTPIIRGSQLKKCSANNYDAQTNSERALKDLADLSALLPDTEFVVGSKPTSYDCMVWAVLAAAVHSWFRNPVTEAARADRRVVGYVERMNTALKFEIAAPRWV